MDSSSRKTLGLVSQRDKSPRVFQWVFGAHDPPYLGKAGVVGNSKEC